MLEAPYHLKHILNSNQHDTKFKILYFARGLELGVHMLLAAPVAISATWLALATTPRPRIGPRPRLLTRLCKAPHFIFITLAAKLLTNVAAIAIRVAPVKALTAPELKSLLPSPAT